MGWDSSTKKLTYPFTKIAANGQGDLQKALSSSRTSQSELFLYGTVHGISKMKAVTFPYAVVDRMAKMSAYGKSLWWWQGHPYTEEIAAGLVIGNYTTAAKGIWIHSCGLKIIALQATDVARAFDPAHNAFHDLSAASNPLWHNYEYCDADRPDGSASAPMRALDFDKYCGAAGHGIVTDYNTKTGTTSINVNNPNSNKVKFSLTLPDWGNYPGGLGLDDLFGPFSGSFVIVIADISTNPATIINGLSQTTTANTESYKERTVDFSTAAAHSALNKNLICLYCASVTVSGTTYYAPVMQSNLYCPNTPVTYDPGVKVYKQVRCNSGSVFNMSAQCKSAYNGSWVNIPNLSSINSSNSWYLKFSMPKKSNTSYYVENDDFKIEFAGMFTSYYGSQELQSLTVTSAERRFVVKSSDPGAADWGTTESVIIIPGSGSVDVYMAMYSVFQDIANPGGTPVVFTRGGTIYRIRIWFLDGQTDYADDPDLEYGSLDQSHLNISVPSYQ